MDDYDKLFLQSDDGALRRCRQVLLLVGLFDQPAQRAWVDAVRSGDPIPELTDLVHDDGAFDDAVGRLRSLHLLNEAGPVGIGLAAPDDDAAGGPGELAAHPLIRARFGELARNVPEYPEANRRLFEFFANGEHQPDTAAALAPLFRAVVHGCRAGLFHRAFRDVYLACIMRGSDQLYAITQLGLLGPVLTCLSEFFEPGTGPDRWGRPVSFAGGGVTESDQAKDAVLLLLHAGMAQTTLYGFAASGAEEAYKSLAGRIAGNVGSDLKLAVLLALWRIGLSRGNVRETLRLALEMEALAARPPTDGQFQGESGQRRILFSAVRNVAVSYFFLGRFDAAVASAQRGLDFLRWFGKDLEPTLAQSWAEVTTPASALLHVRGRLPLAPRPPGHGPGVD